MKCHHPSRSSPLLGSKVLAQEYLSRVVLTVCKGDADEGEGAGGGVLVKGEERVRVKGK